MRPEESEPLLFCDENVEPNPIGDTRNVSLGPAWKILIVDDEVEIHDVTKLALADLVFEQEAITFLSAFSAREAREILDRHESEIALVLLDVVMESETSGLELIDYIRKVLRNDCIRIILRTGQPGRISESVLVFDYDINDYKLKTELTRQNLVKTIVTALRTFMTLNRIERSRQELEKVVLEHTRLYEQLEEYNRTLEEKVAERTRELQQKNWQLQQEIFERQRAETALQRANRELERLAILDSLTGVANRRRFEQYLKQMWEFTLSTQKPLSLLLCDVDYFKSYNDTYGHPKGDMCLRAIADAIARSLRHEGDLVARYGGEEFVAILPETELSCALEIAQIIRQQLQALKIEHSGSRISNYITISIGIVSQIPDRHTSLQDLVKAADVALYQAKQDGRDRIATTSSSITYYS
jgi:diguanylate cyclase (GGDEF)-like protein